MEAEPASTYEILCTEDALSKPKLSFPTDNYGLNRTCSIPESIARLLFWMVAIGVGIACVYLAAALIIAHFAGVVEVAGTVAAIVAIAMFIKWAGRRA
jgi:hypothetical protein